MPFLIYLKILFAIPLQLHFHTYEISRVSSHIKYRKSIKVYIYAYILIRDTQSIEVKMDES